MLAKAGFYYFFFAQPNRGTGKFLLIVQREHVPTRVHIHRMAARTRVVPDQTPQLGTIRPSQEHILPQSQRLMGHASGQKFQHVRRSDIQTMNSTS